MHLSFQKFICCLFLILTFFSCAIVPSVLSESEMGADSLLIGTGGGFTGRETAYLLTSKGLLYQKKASKYEKVGIMDIKWARQAFFVYETQNLEEMDTHAPGNTYYFIERHKAGTVKKLIWGKESGQPEILYQFHRFLWNQIAILQDQKK